MLQQPHLKKLIEGYFTYNSPPVDTAAITNLFSTQFTAQYPSGSFQTRESYAKHVKRTAAVANAMFRHSAVYADPSCLDASFDAIAQDDNEGVMEQEVIVDWKYDYTWRIIGVKGSKKGVNTFRFVQEMSEGASTDEYGGWRIKFVSTLVGSDSYELQ